MFKDLESFFVEVYISANQSSIEVVRLENGIQMISDPTQRKTVVSDADLVAGVPVTGLDDISTLVDLVEKILEA